MPKFLLVNFTWKNKECVCNVPIPQRYPLPLSHNWARPSIHGLWQSCLIAGGPRLPLVAWLSRISIPVSQCEIVMYAPPCKSCLFANTRSSASFISRSWMMRVSSVRASSMRVASFESMTKIRPWVPVVFISTPSCLMYLFEAGQVGRRVQSARMPAYPEPCPRVPTYQKSSASTGDESCPGRRHPIR
jgi:hypothetical protein